MSVIPLCNLMSPSHRVNVQSDQTIKHAFVSPAYKWISNVIPPTIFMTQQAHEPCMLVNSRDPSSPPTIATNTAGLFSNHLVLLDHVCQLVRRGHEIDRVGTHDLIPDTKKLVSKIVSGKIENGKCPRQELTVGYPARCPSSPCT